MKIRILLAFLVLFQNINASSLPPVPEAWAIQIDYILKGIKNEHWLKDYIFLAPLRVKPGYPWNAKIEATWIGPSLIDPAFLSYIQLDFTPAINEYDLDWSGDKFLIAKSYNSTSKKIIFEPKTSKAFMIAPKNKIGVYTQMYFTLSINGKKIPSMFITVNTRTNRDVEVTCSDGIFCNGEERFVKGACVKPKFKPCDDPTGNPCRSYDCVEADRQCKFEPKGGENCKKCNSTEKNSTVICQNLGYECGYDESKTIFCGSCSSKDDVCSKNKCIPKSTLGEGSCNQPYQLYSQSLVIPSEGIQNLTIYGNLNDSKYIDNVIPICNPAPVPDVVYVFKIESKILMGFEALMLKADGTTDEMDTVLTLTDENCDPLSLYSFCGDDNTPPGGVSSRVFGKLNNGTYKLVATAFSSIEANLAPYKILIKFYPNCIPDCEGNRKCGSDGCGGVCGYCSDGKICDLNSGQCRFSVCQPQCSLTFKNNVTELKECGDDECDGLCGSCNLKNQEMCSSQIGKCVKVDSCNNLIPECSGNPPKYMEYPFCGHDCKWHDMKEPFGDLIPNGPDKVLPSIEFNWVSVLNRSCAIAEGCFKYTGNRFLMRFDTYVHNVGKINFNPPSAVNTPNHFQYSPCHAHFHFNGFAIFNLYDMNSTLAVEGGKRGYCMEDTVQTTFGEHIPCTNVYDCSNQGIQPGWADLYPSVLDCQWIDITNIEKEKWYVYEICSNVERKLQEANNLNDCKRFPVYIPDIPLELDVPSVKYQYILNTRNITQTPSIQIEPGSELDQSKYITTKKSTTTRKTTKRTTKKRTTRKTTKRRNFIF